jgi:hypothetical protein
MGKYCRSFRYVNEKKLCAAVAEYIDEYGSLLRCGSSSRFAEAKRRDPWDDEWVSIDHSWKSHRKTQYRVSDDRPKQSSRKFAEHMARRDHWHREHARCPWHPCVHCRKHEVEYVKKVWPTTTAYSCGPFW